MINSKGIIQNNDSTCELLRQLKNNGGQCKCISFREERNMISSETKVLLDENNKPIIDFVDKRGHVYFKYEKLSGYDNVKEQLILRHIRRVFNLSKKYSKSTRDFDGLIAKGLYGLVIAADKFCPYMTVLNKKGEIPYEKDGKTPKFIKFITYATNWILKYLRQEFCDRKTTSIDNNSISINETPRIRNSTDNNQTVENYVETMISPDSPFKPTDIDSELSVSDMNGIYKAIYEYVNSENNLSAMDKDVFINSFYNHMAAKDIAKKWNSNLTTIMNKKKKVISFVKEMLNEKLKIKSFYDIKEY